MRDALEQWARVKWPRARIVHELVVGRGDARADLAVIDVDHFVAIEIKSDSDSTTRLLHQAAMFRLVAPELWIVTCERYGDDAELVRFLMPTIGTARIKFRHRPGTEKHYQPEIIGAEVEVTGRATPFTPHAKSMLQLLWVAELHAEARHHRVVATPSSRPGTHGFLVNKMLELDHDEQVRAVCRQLRQRQAQWRADPPMRDA